MDASKIIVLTTGSEEKSARRLGYPTYTYLPYGQNLKDKVIIRWGNGFLNAPIENIIFSETDDFDNVINRQKSIELNVDKPKALQTISKAVLTPKIYLTAVPNKKIVVFRPKTHSSGQGFQLLKGPFNIVSESYATEYIKTEKEIRVFVCGNKTLTCSREKAKKADSDICRSNYAYVRFRKTPIRLHRMALRATKALNLEVGAFDVLVKNRKYYFLEFNTAVSVEKQATEFYKKNIPVLIKKRFPAIYNQKVELKPKPSFFN